MFNLRNSYLQDTILEFGFDVLLFNIFAYIEGSCTLAGIAFTTDVNALVVLFVLVNALGSADGQVAVFQFGADVFFLKARQVNVNLSRL